VQLGLCKGRLDRPCAVVVDGHNELQENCSLIAAVDEAGGSLEKGRPEEDMQEVLDMPEDDLLDSLMLVAVWVVGCLPHEPRRREFASSDAAGERHEHVVRA
jgi:hypothetical protein